MANDEAQQQEAPTQELPAGDMMERSASSTIIQGVAATGALCYGLGHLAEGVAKAKDAFGSSGGPANTSEQTAPQQTQAQPTNTDDA